MKILVINAGSSSLKYQLIDMENEQVIAKGNCERIGIDGKLSHKTADGRSYEKDIDMKTHTDAFKCVEQALTGGEGKVIDSMDDITAAGHRVVQGGSIFSESVLIDDKVLSDINSLCELAPLHNPAHVQGIRACIDCLGPDVPQCAVFDTSFHQTMPEEAYMFALPYEYYEKYKIRRYGFHGTSHKYVSARCIELLNLQGMQSKIITCHLGNGSSISAIKDGKCIDTSMGFTPLDGFMMGTRTGGIDPSALLYLMDKENLSTKQASDLMNKKSGVLGISAVSSDNRDLEAAIEDGNVLALLAARMQRYQIRKYIGQYVAALDGVDAIVFTGGIGENVSNLRADICSKLRYIGAELDFVVNDITKFGKEAEISTARSKVRLMVIPTNEELVIARDTKRIVNELQ